MEKKQKRIAYKRQYRQIQKRKRHTNAFIVEYTRTKFPYVHNEAINFYTALEQLYPDKDVTRTREFKSWKQSISNLQEPEPGIIVNHLYTDVTLEEKATESDNNSDTESDNHNNNSNTESDNDNNNSDTENDNDNSNMEMPTKQKNFEDNMVLQIPLGIYSPSNNQNQNENNRSIVSDEPPNANNKYDFNAFSNERLREIVNELRDDPELREIFWDQENDLNDEDEGVELKSLEEEVMLDFEPFDYRLEVELADW